jgi:membrane associated rhomboid family serine protease
MTGAAFHTRRARTVAPPHRPMTNPAAHATHDPRRPTPAVQILIAVCAAILFLQWTVVTDADVFSALGFQNGSLQRAPWTVVTYSFAHYGFWHLMVSMYALLAFGPRLEAAMGTRAFTLYYFWCALGGAIAHLLFVRTGILVGASAAVLGVMFGYAQQWPDEEVLLFGVLPVRAWTVVLLFAVANLAFGMVGAGDVAGGDRVVYLAHLGGLAFGWLYFRTPPAASIERLRQRISPAPDYQDELPPRAVPKTLPRQRGGTGAQRDEVDEVVAKSKAIAAQRPASRVLLPPPRPLGETRVAELDRVLDKISAGGLANLSPADRAVLDEMARRLRDTTGER